MLHKIKIGVSILILIFGVVISLSYYIEYRQFQYLKNYGKNTKAIIIDKIDDVDIEPVFREPPKYNIPPRGKHIPFHFRIRQIVITPNNENEFSQESNSRISDLFIGRKQDWNYLQILDTINVYTSNKYNGIYFYEKDVQSPPFITKNYFIPTLIGLVLSILLYMKSFK